MPDAKTILRDYLNDILRIRGTGQAVPETSYYGAMEKLFNAIGQELEQPVFCVLNPKNRGAGIPDGGLFLDIDSDDVRLNDRTGFGRQPERGVVEAKSTGADIESIANGEQVEKYLNAYGQVLVTNFYQFQLVTRSATGVKRISEPYKLAQSEADFWDSNVSTIIKEHAKELSLFLQHVMLLPAPISEPKELASALAYYARYTKARIERDDVDLSVLINVKKQLEQALGVRFEQETGDEFFRSTLVQTLFYGIFSAWVLWHESDPPEGEKFELWRHIRDLNVPAIQELFEQMTAPSRLRPLNIEEILERTADTLNRVSSSFFTAFEKSEAVQYFYEPFLEAFDPKLREQLGVWYTPPQVVKYMVARVDVALRDELGIADGLLSDQVYVLDPCCGTGAYLVEVVRYIYQKAVEREGELMAGQAVLRALIGSENHPARVFGFEILPAPFVIAHLQIGLMLRQMRSPMPDGSRAGIYLTNALTGWDEAPKTQIMFPELAKERDAAQNVKQKEPILVILGNPPYYGKADAPPLRMDEERSLIEAYRETAHSDAPDPIGQGRNDLYVRFYRMAERKITESTGRGIVCYISNYSWLDGLSHPGMRERYLSVFDSITIDSLNGDRYRTGKIIPKGQTGEGQTDPSIFSTPFNRDGIQVGTAIATLVRRQEEQHGIQQIHFRELWGRNKLAQLEAEANTDKPPTYEAIIPEVQLGYPLTKRLVAEGYLSWLKLPDLFLVSFPGVKTSKDNIVVNVEKQRLEEQVKIYFAGNDFLDFNSAKIVSYYYRPFDVRWLYWDELILDRARPEYLPHIQPNNPFFLTTARTRKQEIEPPISTCLLSDLNVMDSGARAFPLYLYDSDKRDEPKTKDMFEEELKSTERRVNLSKKAQGYLSALDADPELLFYHALAIMHATVYRAENAGALRQDWPRIPLPVNLDLLQHSASIGRQLATLLDVEREVHGVTSGDVRPDLHDIAVLKTVDATAPDFKLNGWGRITNGAVYGKNGTIIINDEGELDVYVNETTYWANVSQEVWDYTLGGYKVLKKWLSYRDYDVLGRNLHPDEARLFMHIARRITAILALESQLDENYAVVKANLYEWAEE